VSVGFRAYSSSWAIPPSPDIHPAQLRLPGGAQLDLSWVRATAHGNLRASVENVFDRQLYGTQSTPDYTPLQPRRSLGISATFMN